MSAAMSSLAARLGGKQGVAEEGNTSLEPPASEAEVSGTRQSGFEVARPPRGARRFVGAKERTFDSTALAAASAGVSPTPTAVQPLGGGSVDMMPARSSSRGGMLSSAADAYSEQPQYDFDPTSGTLPPGAAQQALLLPYRTRPSSTTPIPSATTQPKLDEEMFWVSTSRPQSHSSRPPSTSSSRMMAVALSGGGETRDSRQQVSTSSSKGKIAELMQAEVVNAEDVSDGSAGGTPPAIASGSGPMLGLDTGEERKMFDAEGRLVGDAINFDRPINSQPVKALKEFEGEPKPLVWDAAQAYNS